MKRFIIHHLIAVHLAMSENKQLGRKEQHEKVYGAVAASEYYGDRFEQDFKCLFPQVDHFRIEGDGPCLISGMLGHTDGAGLICGTGSALYVRIGDSYYHVGGWGPIVDSCGSGYTLTRKALHASIREIDGRSGPTLLTPLFTKYMGVPLQDNFDAIYRKGRAYISSFVNVVFEAAQSGDAIALAILQQGASDLGELITTARRRVGHGFQIICNGGVLKHYPQYVKMIRNYCPTDVSMIQSDVPPVFGAAVEALYDVGCTTNFETLKKNFKAQFARISP